MIKDCIVFLIQMVVFFTTDFFHLYEAFLIMVCFMSRKIFVGVLWSIFGNSLQPVGDIFPRRLWLDRCRFFFRGSLCVQILQYHQLYQYQFGFKYFDILKKVSITCTLCKLAGASPSEEKRRNFILCLFKSNSLVLSLITVTKEHQLS